MPLYFLIISKAPHINPKIQVSKAPHTLLFCGYANTLEFCECCPLQHKYKTAYFLRNFETSFDDGITMWLFEIASNECGENSCHIFSNSRSEKYRSIIVI